MFFLEEWNITTQILTAVFSRVRVVKENMVMTVCVEYEKQAMLLILKLHCFEIRDTFEENLLTTMMVSYKNKNTSRKHKL